MKIPYLLAVAAVAILAGGGAAAQSVRTSPSAFPLALPPLQLPVAPASALPLVPAGGPGAATARYGLRSGEPIHTGIKTWAEADGWLLIWHPAFSWKTLRETAFEQKDVVAAITEVIDILRDEGKPVQLRVSDGNRVIEVLSTEVRTD